MPRSSRGFGSEAARKLLGLAVGIVVVDNAQMLDFIDIKRDTLIQHLRKHIQGEVRFDDTSRKLYSTDASIYMIEPLGVVIPRTVADVQVTVEVASEMGVPITARGGGTSLSGQSIGPGIVLDCSKYLNNVLDIDASGGRARIQPGVVLDQLNNAAATNGLQFGPDVSTSNRANLGGMIGNNSAGARSVIYGKTVDHIHALNVVLADGKPASFGPLSPKDWERRASLRSLEGTIYRKVRDIVERNESEIRHRFPNILRRVSGYNLDLFCNRKELNLSQLIVGSEGTLAVVTEAEVKLVPRPKVRGLVVLHFISLSAAVDAVAVCLELKPSAIELMDQLFLDLARDNPGLKGTMTAIHGRPGAVLMIEFSSDNPAEVVHNSIRLEQRLRGATGVTEVVQASDPKLRDPLWDLRSASVPLLYSIRGDRKPVAFVEDCAVAPARLPEFVERFREILHQHGTEGAFYGHASVGCLHIRPLLNLKDHAEVVRMRRIAEAVSDLVLEFGGAMSGEHGDGLARSEWNRKMFGPIVYEAFCQVKHAFDPDNILNPGKVVHAPAMTESLRYPPDYAPAEPVTLFDYSRQEGFVRSIEICNGSGACRKLQGGTMCPSYRATLDEKDSTRGRANALRLALSGKQPVQELRSQWLYDVLDLCLMCKACKTECPSNVDMAKLKAEFLRFYHEGKSRPLGHYLMARIYRMNQLGSRAASFIHWLQSRRLVRWLLEKMAGLDRRRSIPPIHADHFRRWFARHKPVVAAGRHGKIILLDDCFTTFYEPEISRAAVHVVEQAGYRVELAGINCCCRPMISKGFLSEARTMIREQAAALAARVSEGTPILGLEPSCLLTLTDEWPELAPGLDTRRIARSAALADDWLAGQAKAGKCDLSLRGRSEKCLLHGHCHQKALCGLDGTVAALQLAPGLQVTPLDTGCCGMAGSFGFEREHYDLSVKIAELSLLPALAKAPDTLIVAPGTSCRHQIKDLTGRRALHPMEVLAERMREVDKAECKTDNRNPQCRF